MTKIKRTMIYSITVLSRYKNTKTEQLKKQSNKRKKNFKFRFLRAMAIHRRKEIPGEKHKPSQFKCYCYIPIWNLAYMLGSDTNDSDHIHSHP